MAGEFARVTQLAVEVLVVNSDTKARVTQLAVEVLSKNSDTKARVTQLAVEVLVVPAAAAAGRSHVVIVA